VVSSGAAGSDLDGMTRQIASDWYGTTDIGGTVAVVGTPDGTGHVADVGSCWATPISTVTADSLAAT
jgi:hypothetical protein